MVKQDLLATRTIGIATVLLALLSSPSCETPPHLVIHQSDTATVVLREMPVGYPTLTPFHHPYTIAPKEVFDILTSLHYEAGLLLPLSRSHPRSLFTKPQAELLAPELSRALTQALPQHVTAFTITDEEKPDRRTKGLAFVRDDELHVIIEELHRLRYEGEQPTYQQPVSRWSLFTSGNHRHYARHPGGKGEAANWIITPLR